MTDTSTARPDAGAVRVKLINGDPLTHEETAALYTVMLAVNGVPGTSEGGQAAYGRNVSQAYAHAFTIDQS